MDNYNARRPCRKCGNNGFGVSTHYMRTAWSYEEVIRRVCQRCGFAWDEKPLDASRDRSAVRAS